MTAFLIILHVLVCVFLILFVLLQPGARGGVGAAFGGAGGQTVFGGRGANTFLAKLTAAAAIIFMVTSISLSYFVSHNKSVMAKKAAATAVEDKKNKDNGSAPAPSGAPADDSESGAGPSSTKPVPASAPPPPAP